MPIFRYDEYGFSLNKMSAVVYAFTRLRPIINGKQIQMFLEVAAADLSDNEEDRSIDFKVFADTFKINATHTRYNIEALCEYDHQGNKGLGLCEVIQSPRHHKAKAVVLSDKGSLFAGVLADMVECEDHKGLDKVFKNLVELDDME